MSVNLRSLTPYRITDFSGGLNEFDSSFTMDDKEVQASSNMELRSGGAVRTRQGAPAYQVQSYGAITLPPKDLFRYSRFNGDKKILMYAGSILYADDDEGKFDVVRSVPSDDGHSRMVQWREAVLFGTKTFPPYAYDPTVWLDPALVIFFGADHTIDLTVLTGVGNGPTLIFGLTGKTVADGTLTLLGTYTYRFTLDIYMGNTFLGETGVCHFGAALPGFGLGVDYSQSSITLAGTENAVDITVPGAPSVVSPEGIHVGAFNIYRTLISGTAPSIGTPEPNMVLVGSVSYEFFAAGGTNIAIDDRGLVAGRSIAPYYSRTVPIPRGRFLEIHKSRLWLGNVQFSTLDLQSRTYFLTEAPHRVYFSEINEVGAVLPTSWIEIDATDGDGITGIISYRNKVLLVFKANAIWAVSGGDDEIGPGIPDISIEQISNDVGCVAPESIQNCEGRIVFLSHRGIYYYDGSIPKPLKTENIDETILDRPANKFSDCPAIFFSKEREYWIAHSNPLVNPTYNTLISKFSFQNGSWMRDTLGTSSGLTTGQGVSSFVEKKEMDTPPRILAGIDASPAELTASSAIRTMGLGGLDGGDIGDIAGSVAVGAAVTWSWGPTKFYDLKTPYMDKKFVAVLVQLESETDVTMKVSCDNHLVNEPFTILKTENDQDFDLDEMVWANDAGTIGSNWSDGVTGTEWAGENSRNALVYLNTKCWGKRIAFTFNGSTTASPTEIQALTIFYDGKEGVRQ